MATTIKFWKIIGGYTYLIKWKGRWHWGLGGQFALDFSKTARDNGYKLIQVGEPKALRQAWAKHGATLATIKKEFPPFNIREMSGGRR